METDKRLAFFLSRVIDEIGEDLKRSGASFVIAIEQIHRHWKLGFQRYLIQSGYEKATNNLRSWPEWARKTAHRMRQYILYDPLTLAHASACDRMLPIARERLKAIPNDLNFEATVVALIDNFKSHPPDTVSQSDYEFRILFTFTKDGDAVRPDDGWTVARRKKQSTKRREVIFPTRTLWAIVRTHLAEELLKRDNPPDMFTRTEEMEELIGLCNSYQTEANRHQQHFKQTPDNKPRRNASAFEYEEPKFKSGRSWADIVEEDTK